jgi:hypothetical protein
MQPEFAATAATKEEALQDTEKPKHILDADHDWDFVVRL